MLLLSGLKTSPGSFKERWAQKGIRIMCYLNSKINISQHKIYLQKLQLEEQNRKENFEVGVPC
jgi:hypothetical protein